MGERPRQLKSSTMHVDVINLLSDSEEEEPQHQPSRKGKSQSEFAGKKTYGPRLQTYQSLIKQLRLSQKHKMQENTEIDHSSGCYGAPMPMGKLQPSSLRRDDSDTSTRKPGIRIHCTTPIGWLENPSSRDRGPSLLRSASGFAASSIDSRAVMTPRDDVPVRPLKTTASNKEPKEVSSAVIRKPSPLTTVTPKKRNIDQQRQLARKRTTSAMAATLSGHTRQPKIEFPSASSSVDRPRISKVEKPIKDMTDKLAEERLSNLSRQHSKALMQRTRPKTPTEQSGMRAIRIGQPIADPIRPKDQRKSVLSMEELTKILKHKSHLISPSEKTSARTISASGASEGNGLRTSISTSSTRRKAHKANKLDEIAIEDMASPSEVEVEIEAEIEPEDETIIPSDRRTLRKRTQMQTEALKRRDKWRDKYKNHKFMTQLQDQRPSVIITNEVDDEEPPTNFKFINRNKFTGKAIRPESGALYGCSCKTICDPRTCTCIDERNAELQPNNEPWGLPYAQNQRLTKPYLSSRLAIFECNSQCACKLSCRNRNIQSGRRIALEIFKTATRGWGLRSPEYISKGQFVDTYCGEILTDKEATQRSSSSSSKNTTTPKRDIYLFALDKFKETLHAAGQREYVIDGNFFGGPSRFINHSCAPNLRAFAVSLVRGNPQVYELAFFAVRDILPGEELGFDYQDREGIEDGDGDGEDGEGDGDGGGMECLCGADKCRGRFW